MLYILSPKEIKKHLVKEKKSHHQRPPPIMGSMLISEQKITTPLSCFGKIKTHSLKKR